MSEPPPSRAQGSKSIRPSAAPRDLMAEEARLARAWQAQVITLFPEAFPGVLGLSLTGRALERGLWQLSTIPLREFGEGRHRNVDDTPAGGGAGMVLRADVVGQALNTRAAPRAGIAPMIYLSPRGRPFDQVMARQLAQGPDGASLLCGRFEGVDQRVLDHFGIEEVSIGDFVMTGGEIAAQAHDRRGGATAARRSGQCRDRARKRAFERPAGASALHRPAEWHGADDPRCADVRPPRRHRRVAARAGRGADPVTPTRSVGETPAAIRRKSDASSEGL